MKATDILKLSRCKSNTDYLKVAKLIFNAAVSGKTEIVAKISRETWKILDAQGYRLNKQDSGKFKISWGVAESNELAEKGYRFYTTQSGVALYYEKTCASDTCVVCSREIDKKIHCDIDTSGFPPTFSFSISNICECQY